MSPPQKKSGPTLKDMITIIPTELPGSFGAGGGFRKPDDYFIPGEATEILSTTLPKFNIDPEKLPKLKPNRKVFFQPSFFRGELLNFRGVSLPFSQQTLGIAL